MSEITWEITDHICRKCGGRILRSVSGAGVTPGGNSIHRCADCGASTTRMGPGDVCWCDFKMRGQTYPAYRCVSVSWADGDDHRMDLLRRSGYCDSDSRQVVPVLRKDLSDLMRAEEQK